MGKVISLSQAREEADQDNIPLYQLCEASLSRRNRLNKFCTSLFSEKNQQRFRAFPEGYCREYELSLEQIHAVTDLDIMRLLKLGITLNALHQLFGVYDLDLHTLCSEQTGRSLDELIKSID